MPESDNREFVQGLYAALAEGNPGPLFEAMDEDFVTYEAESLPFGGEHRGPAANQRLVESISRYVDFASIKMDQFLAGGDLVMALGTVVWRGVDGDQALEMPLGEIWEVRNRRLISARPFYLDTAAMLAPKAKEATV
ncbi:nuclear transport factor 2 family protein [[Mycobacterium] burgundiense]|uniref:Nuclear transport factor 2 family protein n=1 Tax=[Mycobacterium] burgundiense TaxID=3064286 RepID=A0ABM9M7A4_9MYCO|nr:nuclear transport factor 2 family protein [Mycolicibacterium sp. MU0053]CAJ1511082.1 nuclear transport factor 2 family protein [Mycolicibacterium sp. MU0053]